MTGDAAAVELAVQDRDDDDRWTTIGRVAYGDRGVLSLVDAEPVYRDYVEELVGAVNALDRIKIKSPPPPGGEPGSVYSKTVTRDHPELLSVVADYAEQNFGLRLATAERLAASDPGADPGRTAAVPKVSPPPVEEVAPAEPEPAAEAEAEAGPLPPAAEE